MSNAITKTSKAIPLVLCLGTAILGTGSAVRAADAGSGVIEGYGRTAIAMTIYQGASARVTLVGQPGIDVDLKIYDSHGRLVGTSSGPGHVEWVCWNPACTGVFYAVVSNCDPTPSRYVLTLE